MLRARFTHDCSECKLFASDSRHDWYTCGKTVRGLAERTVIARYGDNGSEYISTPLAGFAARSPMILGALAHGLQLTEHEAREMLASILTSNLPRAAFEYLPDECDMPSNTIHAAILRTPEGT